MAPIAPALQPPNSMRSPGVLPMPLMVTRSVMAAITIACPWNSHPIGFSDAVLLPTHSCARAPRMHASRCRCAGRTEVSAYAGTRGRAGAAHVAAAVLDVGQVGAGPGRLGRVAALDARARELLRPPAAARQVRAVAVADRATVGAPAELRPLQEDEPLGGHRAARARRERVAGGRAVVAHGARVAVQVHHLHRRRACAARPPGRAGGSAVRGASGRVAEKRSIDRAAAARAGGADGHGDDLLPVADGGSAECAGRGGGG